VLLTDAGPLVTLLDRRDVNYPRCVSVVANRLGPMMTTWPAFTEAMFLAGRGGGWPWQEQLWRWIASGALVLYDLTPRMVMRMPVLMERYSDLPMDLADASLVALAEEQGLRQVFTLERDFQVYRLPNGAAFELVPS
jgi:predicted nucleic acid-binding protein